MSTDDRSKLYADLHGRQMTGEDALNRSSAQTILGILFDYIQPKSVLDVGCGLGTWLAVAKEMGVADIRGIEGAWLDRSKLAIDSGLIETIDLEKPFSLNRKFDLVICLEVAEHLSADAADAFVKSLVDHGEVILFSAAIPFQGGHHHVNEQWLEYWAQRFAQHNFRWIELFRAKIWNDPNVLWWLQQNMVLMVHDRVLEANAKLRDRQREGGMLSVVHPETYRARIVLLRRAMAESQEMLKTLSQGGTFQITPGANNTMTITKL